MFDSDAGGEIMSEDEQQAAKQGLTLRAFKRERDRRVQRHTKRFQKYKFGILNTDVLKPLELRQKQR